MRLTSFGMFAIMKETTTKIWDWRNILTGMIRSPSIKMICGSNHSRHRLHRKEICKLLDKSWKSFYRLKESGGIENPGTPRYKKDKMPITYMQKGIQHENGSFHVRLSLPKKLKEYMAHTYDIRAAYLYLKNPVFSNMDIIKQIKIYPPANDGTSRILVIYEVEDVLPEEDNGHYLSIDLGLHNLMTCYDNVGKTFIIGREYLSLSYFYNKEIARVQSQ